VIVKGLLKEGKTFTKQILSEWSSRDEALSHEVLLHEIFYVDTNPLFLNRARQTSQRFTFNSKGLKPKPETILKMRKNNKGSNNPMAGRKQSEASKEKNRQKQLGKSHSVRTREQMAISHRGKVRNTTLYTLRHVEHGKVTLTKAGFKERYGLHSSAISNVIKGMYKSTRGWTL
jgi:hypothetical protein